MNVMPANPSLRLFYLLLIGVGSLLAHLASEFASMGTEADGVVFSARHWYLGLGVIVGVVIFFVRGRSMLRQSVGSRDLKRILSVGLAALPFGGRGIRFLGLTAGLQLAIGAVTQIGEGCPFCGHDVAAGLLGALLTVLALALITRAIGRQLPSIVSALVGYLPRASGVARALFVERIHAFSVAGPGVWFPHLFNRPPPFLQIFASA